MSISSKSEFSEASNKKSVILKKITSSQSLSDIRNACFAFYMSGNDDLNSGTENACRAILDWHMEKISDRSVTPEAVIKSLNTCMEYVGCSPLDETSSGPHSDEQQKLRDLIFERTMVAISSANNGDLVNMHLKNFTRALEGLSAHMTPEHRAQLCQSIEESDSEWRQSNLRALGCAPVLAFA